MLPWEPSLDLAVSFVELLSVEEREGAPEVGLEALRWLVGELDGPLQEPDRDVHRGVRRQKQPKVGTAVPEAYHSPQVEIRSGSQRLGPHSTAKASSFFSSVASQNYLCSARDRIWAGRPTHQEGMRWIFCSMTLGRNSWR